MQTFRRETGELALEKLMAAGLDMPQPQPETLAEAIALGDCLTGLIASHLRAVGVDVPDYAQFLMGKLGEMR